MHNGQCSKPSVAFLSISLYAHQLRPFFSNEFPEQSQNQCFRRRLSTTTASVDLSTLPSKVRSGRVVACAASVDEELFIRRNASIRLAPTKMSAPPSAKVNTEDEHFDFVQQQPPSSSTTKSSNSPTATGKTEASDAFLPPKSNKSSKSEAHKKESVSSSESQAAQTDPKHSTRQKENGPIPLSVRLFPRSAPGWFINRLRREASREVNEGQLIGTWRFPSRTETIALAGELALVVAILMLLRAGVSRTLRWIHVRINDTRGKRSNITYEASVFECMQRPLEFLSLFTVGTALAEAVSRPLAATGLLRHIRSLRELGVIIAATWFLLRWIDRIRSRFAADKRVDSAQLDATARFATVATFIVSLLISLDTVGVNVQAVLAFGGIGGVAIGFAGREIISNFFGGFMIYVTRPFTVGEWIRCIEESQLNGTVEDIGWYLTRVRTWDKRPLYIPNSRFSTLIVENGSRMDNRRIVHTLHLRLEDIPVISTIVSQMEDVLMGHPALDPKQHRLAYVDSYDDFSVRIWFSCYTKSVFLYDFRDVQQELLLKFFEIIRANGARLANRNTRDVRPGVNTDQYGPYGQYATFSGSAQATISEEDSAMAQERRRTSLVDNVPYATVQDGEEHHAAADAAVNGAGMAADGSVVHREVKSDENETQKRARSAETISAVASALAAAKRIASRKEQSTESSQRNGNAKSDGMDNSGNGTGSSSGNGTPEVKSPVSSGQMKISKAPSPRTSNTGGNSTSNPASTGSGVKSGTASSAQNGNGNGTATTAVSTDVKIGEESDTSKKGGGKDSSTRAETGNANNPHKDEGKAGTNQMKISKASGRGPVPVPSKQSTTNTAVANETKSADDANSKPSAKHTDGNLVSDSKSTNSELKTITNNKAASRNSVTENASKTERVSATDVKINADEQQSSSKSSGKEEATISSNGKDRVKGTRQSNAPHGEVKASTNANTSSSGQMKISAARPNRNTPHQTQPQSQNPTSASSGDNKNSNNSHKGVTKPNESNDQNN